MFPFNLFGSKSNEFDKENNKKYYWEIGLGTVLYLALGIVQGWSYHLWQLDEGPWRVPVALAPMIGLLVCLWAGWRMFKRVDERQRLFIQEDITVAAFGTAVITFGYGFLEQVGFPRLSMFYVWGILGSLWIITYFANRFFRR